MSEIPPLTEDQMTTRCVGLRFTEDTDDCSEIWQIVFDKDGENAKLAVIHGYEPCRTDRKLKRYMSSNFTDTKVEGITWQAEPYFLGFKKIDAATKQSSQESIKNMCERESYLIQLKNKYESNVYDADDEGDEYHDKVAYITSLSDQEYEAYAQQMIKYIEETTYIEISEEEAKQKYIQFLMINSTFEKELHSQHVKTTLETHALFEAPKLEL